ncbi:hypothetical protein CJ030_MR5G001876 [Morella rubra]|uniref:Uncharacterized protein n=1 Tax=Morella rubra TaxID=262757 RepID=A0A6A1VJI1_9ROSI|nr:hypothetical protein CJ030_MR5G001876 [Morella rubra]
MACGHQKMHEKILKKWKRYSCSTSQRESHTPKWRFFAEVLGMKAGYVQGLGHSVRYGADDVRASADDGGAATEERQRADADDGRAATKKRRRASEDDGGTAKDPSGTTRTEDATNGGAMREQLVEQIR